MATKTPLAGRDLIRSTGIVIPTCNASQHWGRMQAALEREHIPKNQVLVVDSSSSDNTRELVRKAGYTLKTIPRESFRHGATRQMAAEQLHGYETLVYLTQDACPTGDEPIAALLSALADPAVGAAYGRQLARPEAGAIERHARLFNYPSASKVRTFEDRKTVGFKTVFFSNSFAAYRYSALQEVGGFPRNVIVSEEVTVAARMLMAGWKIAYQADATVIHSHGLTMMEEFHRYFDIGVHHGRERWLLDEFGGAGGEGNHFVKSEIKYLAKNRPLLLPIAAFRNLSKWCSYHLGLNEKYLPLAVKEALSAQPYFWHDEWIPTVNAGSHVTAEPVDHSSIR